MAAKRKPVVLVSSAVYGFEELLDRIYTELVGFKYEVWMSHKGTMPVYPDLTALDSCKRAVNECDLFFGIILPRYGGGKATKNSDAIAHEELREAIRMNKPRWILAHDHVVFARTFLDKLSYDTPPKRAKLKLKVQERETIKNLTALGWGVRKIARELGVSRNTVRQYVRALEPGGGSTVSTPGDQTDPLSTPGSGKGTDQTDPLSTAGNNGRTSLCLDHAPFILAKAEAGLTAQRIYQDLKTESSFAGSYESVKRYVQKLRQTDPKLVHRIEVRPGEEVQVDFGSGPNLAGAEGKRTKTWIFRMVLSYSRKAYSEAVLRQDTETFLRCLENAFRHFGGVALTVNLDNLKAAVLKFDWADPEINPKLIDFARHYGTTIMPCLPKTPEHKGKVESGVKYVKENALAGRKFPSLAALNQFLAHWEKTVADLRIHGTTKRQVAELFALEKPSLAALPASLFPCFREGPRTVHRDGHVEVEKAFYHVPPEYLRQRVWVRFDSREVRIFAQDKHRILKQIQVHRRLEPGQFTNARGIGGGLGSLQANLQYWLGRAGNLGTSCDLWARAVAANRGIGAIRTLMGLTALIPRHSFPELNRACERAHAKGAWRLRDVRTLLEAKQIQTQLPFEERHPLIRDLSEYGQFIKTKNQDL